SMSRPGGNVTGATTLAVELAPKRLELAHELVPTASTIAVLINPTNTNTAEAQLRDLQAAAHTLGLQLHVAHASTEREFDTAFANMAGHHGSRRRGRGVAACGARAAGRARAAPCRHDGWP